MYLESVPQNGESRELYLNWIQYLVDKYGLEKSISVLEDYRSIQWISEETCSQSKENALMCHLNRESVEGDIPKPRSGPLSEMMSSDYEPHSMSLYLMQRMSQ